MAAATLESITSDASWKLGNWIFHCAGSRRLTAAIFTQVVLPQPAQLAMCLNDNTNTFLLLLEQRTPPQLSAAATWCIELMWLIDEQSASIANDPTVLEKRELQ